jgi:hypothetical protein
MQAQSDAAPIEGAEVIVDNVAKEDFAKLVDIMRGEGATVAGDDIGLVENECFAAKYVYDAETKLLRLEPYRVVPGLKPRRLRRTIQQMIAPPLESVASDLGWSYHKPTPHVCAVYNWAIGYFVNNSGGVLTYSGSDTQEGNLSVDVTKINNGDNPDTHADGYWTNQGTKDSGTGAGGSISYQLADGQTTLTVTYFVNTLSTTSCTAALSGQNAARYTASCDKQTEFYYAAAYLYPYVTITKN